MRDLYTRLKVSKTAPVSALERAIELCGDAQLKEDGRAVLLNPQIREAYDQTHAALCNIAVLRANLGLLHSSNWTGSTAADFVCSPSNSPSQLESFQRKLGPKSPRPEHQIGGPGFVVRGIGRAIRFLKSEPLLIVIPLVIGSLWLGELFQDSKPRPLAPSSNPSSPGSIYPTWEDTFNEPELPLPRSGAIQITSTDQRVAPFEIKTSRGANYLVKLVDASTGTDVMTVFVHGGSTVDVEVPIGIFEVRYASGEEWYGNKYLFGPETVYSKADESFHFRYDGNRVSGYTITLYRVRDGNLRTSTISAQDF